MCLGRVYCERRNRIGAVRAYAKQDHTGMARQLVNLILTDVNKDDLKKDIESILMCKDPKINALRFNGKSNCGKSLIAGAICEALVYFSATMCGCAGEFYFGGMINKSIILLEELWVVPATCDDYKTILSGFPLHINKKHETARQILERTPCIITSNYKQWGRGFLSPIDEKALNNRAFQYELNTEITKHMFGRIELKCILFELLN